MRLAIEHLTKDYGGKRAVSDLTFGVEPGCIFGMLGRNGAGKTTTIHCALGLLRPTAGTIAFDGQSVSPKLFHDIAYVPETPALYGWMTGQEHVHMNRSLYRKFDPAYAEQLADVFELPMRQRVRTLSKGQKTALAVLLAFSQRAQMMFMDEPSSGLDPLMQRRLLDLIVRAGLDGVAIVLSSHQIGHIERAAERIVVIEHGRLVLEGDLEALRQNFKIVEAVFPIEASLPTILQRDPHVRSLSVKGRTLVARLNGDVQRIYDNVAALNPISLRIENESLEDIFLTTVDEEAPANVV